MKKNQKKLVLKKKVVAKLTDEKVREFKGGGIEIEPRKISPLCMTYEPCGDAEEQV